LEISVWCIGGGTDSRRSVGFADANNQGVDSSDADDGVATSDIVIIVDNAKCFTTYNAGANGVREAASLTSLDSDGFTLDYTTVGFSDNCQVLSGRTPLVVGSKIVRSKDLVPVKDIAVFTTVLKVNAKTVVLTRVKINANTLFNTKMKVIAGTIKNGIVKVIGNTVSNTIFKVDGKTEKFSIIPIETKTEGINERISKKLKMEKIRQYLDILDRM